MRVAIVLLVWTSCGLVKSQLDSLDQEYCTKEKQGTLESRVNRADVVITGTIIRLETESWTTEKTENGGGDSGRSGPAEEQTRRQTVGLVKLWRVVKGSLEHVTNQTTGPQDLLSSDASDDNIVRSPVVKLYGLWNDHLCESFVTEGDTRIFFLRKFQDVREIPESPKRFEPLTKASNLRAANDTTVVERSEKKVETIRSGARSSTDKPKKKKKGGKDGKKKKNKNRDEKKKKKNKKMKTKGAKKAGKSSRKKSGRKKRKTTDSIYAEWKRLSHKSKRSAELPLIVGQRVKVRRQTIPEKAVLVLNASPARITLANLNHVEHIARSP